jgi:hypothetical protein
MFLVVTLFGELWMALLGGATLFLYQYLAIFIQKDHIWQNQVSTNIRVISNLTRGASFDNVSILSGQCWVIGRAG